MARVTATRPNAPPSPLRCLRMPSGEKYHLIETEDTATARKICAITDQQCLIGIPRERSPTTIYLISEDGIRVIERSNTRFFDMFI